MNASDRYRVQGAECMLDGRRLAVANLSVGGLFAITDRPPIAGQVLSFSLALPEVEPLRIRGQVTWVNVLGPTSDLPPGFGLRITSISFLDKIRLLGFLRRHDATGIRVRRHQQVDQ